MPLQVACIVEGHGETDAVPILVRRIAQIVVPSELVDVRPCLRVPRYRLVKEREVERAVELAARKTGGAGAILILVDSEDACPATLGPSLLHRARQQRGNIPMATVLAKREFESWFLAAAASLRGKRGLTEMLEPPPNPEDVRDAKGWLRARMSPGKKYQEVLDQPALTASFDMAAARSANSFDKCYRDVARMLHELSRRASSLEGGC